VSCGVGLATLGREVNRVRAAGKSQRSGSMRTSTKLIALGLAGALSIGAAAPSFAGPLMSSGAAVRQAAPDHVTDVRWRGRGIGPGLAFGLAAGALVGAAVASRPYGPDYYYEGAPYGAYEGPVYAEPYAYEPVVPAPGYYGYGYRYGQCFTNEGYGRRRPCDAN
jgi:hypothetical protein